MTTQQQLTIEKNATIFDAYDSILKAANENEITFDEMLDMMKTLNHIKN